MTINSVIEKVDGLHSNAFTPEEKAGWIITLDGRINDEVVHGSTYAALEYPADEETVLLAESPHDDVYELYVTAQMYLKQEDYNDYNAAASVFNDAFESFAGWYRRNNQQATSTTLKNLFW